MARSVKLVDVSFWQASNRYYPPVIPMDWVLAARQGVQGAYIKATEALFTDPELVRHHMGAGSQNIKWGCYHFFRDTNFGRAQAEYFLGVTQSLTWEHPPALDVEVICHARELWAWITHVQANTSRWSIIYTSPGAWAKVVDGFTIVGQRFVSYKRLIAEHCDLWQAQYPLPEYDDGVLVIPLSPIQSWTKIGKTAVIHQYSARNPLGPAYGSKGSQAIDLNLADEVWFARWSWPASIPQDQAGDEQEQEVELITRFQGLVNGQNIRAAPSISSGVTGKINAGQVLFPARDVVIQSPSEVWIRFDAGWIAAVYGGRQYLKSVD